jgi:hypothetical protein
LHDSHVLVSYGIKETIIEQMFFQWNRYKLVLVFRCRCYRHVLGLVTKSILSAVVERIGGVVGIGIGMVR